MRQNIYNEKTIHNMDLCRLILIPRHRPHCLTALSHRNSDRTVIMGALGYGTVLVNGELITGIAALPASLLIGLAFIGVFTAVFGTIIFIGLWCYSKFRPLKIKVIN